MTVENERVHFPPRRLLESGPEQLLGDISELYDLGYLEKPFEADPDSVERVDASYRRLMRTLELSDRKIYGIHTFFGDNVRNERDPSQWKETQIDLLTYLQVGVGRLLPGRVVRRALRLQAKKVAFGLSGIHPDTYRALVTLSAQEQMPEVPTRGSLGASGDLITMVHAVAPLFQKTPPRGPRDVIGLINTNAIMGSWAIENYFRLAELHDLVSWNTALVSHAIDAGDENYLENGLGKGRVHRTNLDAGQRIVDLGQIIHSRLADVSHGQEKNLLQPRYSVRCAPQVLGNCDDLMHYASQKIMGDVLAVSDNPLILEDPDDEKMGKPWHGGLFYASGIATAADFMIDVCGKVSELLDRQTLILMDSNLNGSLPDNLSVPGMSHCKGIHQLLSSLAQEIRSLSMPSRLMSFSCEGNNQDIVPCGMTVLNNVDRNLDTLSEIVRGALFCSMRAALLRNKVEIHPRLHISQWSDFSSDFAKQYFVG